MGEAISEVSQIEKEARHVVSRASTGKPVVEILIDGEVIIPMTLFNVPADDPGWRVRERAEVLCISAKLKRLKKRLFKSRHKD